MKSIRHYFIILAAGFSSISLLLPNKVLAFCPMCIVATGTFMGIFRWLGVDDTIVGLWLGGFILSISVVLNNFLIKKGKKIGCQLFLIFVFSYGFFILYLYQFGALSTYNKVFGIDKIFFGMIIGSLLFMLTPFMDRFLRKQNEGKIFVSHQKVLLGVVLLFIVSLGFYFIFQ